MIRYATIGTSWITEAYIRGCMLLGDKFQLAAVYSRDFNKGKEFGARFVCETVYTDLEELAASDVEAVYVASPNAFHYAQSKLMLSHGKHVICEKPITVTPDELEELQTLAREKNLVYMEAHMGSHLPEWRLVTDCIKRLGAISHARFDFSQRSSKLDGHLKGEHQNIFDPKMAAGALMDLGVYCVYPALGWFGMPNDIYSYCVKMSTGVDGSGGAVLRYSDMTVELCWSKTGESRIGSEIIGEKATLVIPSISKLTDMKLIYKDGTETVLSDQPDKFHLMRYEANDFYRYITNFEGFRDELESANRLALEVSRVMLKIREQSGIRFDI